MLFTSGSSPHSHLAQSVFEFFNTKYSVESDVEVFHTDLTEDNAFGFTEINGEEQFIQIHNDLNEKDYHNITSSGWFMLSRMRMVSLMMS